METAEKNTKPKAPKISKEEQQVIDQLLSSKRNVISCQNELITVLEKYNCKIIVNPDSPIKNPSALVVNA